jgi:hypothetical protein
LFNFLNLYEVLSKSKKSQKSLEPTAWPILLKIHQESAHAELSYSLCGGDDFASDERLSL